MLLGCTASLQCRSGMYQHPGHLLCTWQWSVWPRSCNYDHERCMCWLNRISASTVEICIVGSAGLSAQLYGTIVTTDSSTHQLQKSALLGVGSQGDCRNGQYAGDDLLSKGKVLHMAQFAAMSLGYQWQMHNYTELETNVQIQTPTIICNTKGGDLFWLRHLRLNPISVTSHRC